MSSKDKDKTLQDKLKQFFRLNKGNAAGTVVERSDFSLTSEIEIAIGPQSTNVNDRVKTLRDISNVVLQKNLEEHAIEKLWSLVQDLLREDVPKEQRYNVFQFLCNLAQGQSEKLGILRAQFFRLVVQHSLPEDVGARLDLLRALTDNGKDIQYIEVEVAPFLLSWMSEVTHANKTNDLLSLLVNVVKYNAAFVEDDVISGLIQSTCFLCTCSQHEEVVHSSLALLDVIVCYAQMPPEMLRTFVCTLCNCVNNKMYCLSCWKIMKKILGTHLGHSTLFQMVSILKDPKFANAPQLLRGAVFHTSMGMWGNQKVPSLNTTVCTVLPAFMEAIKHGHAIVTYEVLLCLRKLIVHSPSDLSDPAWHIVLGILEIAMILIQKMNPPNVNVATVAHDLLTDIEALHERGDFRGDVGRFFNIIASCASTRPEISILHLITYLAADFTPTKHKWLTKLSDFVERYFWQETRSNIRVKVLDVISSVVHANRALYEEELLERVLTQLDPNVAKDPDLVVRNASVQLLVELCLECENKRCLELLELIDKFLQRPFDLYDANSFIITNEADMIDVKSAALGMIKIFQSKAYQLPSSHAIRAYKSLVNHLECHYKRPAVFDNCSTIRFLIFKCFLQIRADSLYHLGMPDPMILDFETPCSAKKVTRFSPYLAVDHRDGEKPSAAVVSAGTTSAFPTPTVTYLSLTHACGAVIICLKKEKDWRVLTLVLSELPQVMQNKSLILSKHGNDVEYLASALYSMVSEISLGLPDKLKNLPQKMSRSDLQSMVLLSLASLVSYPLDSSMQQKIVKCLQLGLTTTTKCAIDCMSALTLCTLDMQETMYKLLPEVLLKLSKISTTVFMAIPMLEFLSTLTRLPKVFGSFVYDQYLSVFAIALPYTNPFKYSHFVVSLAHHVIAVWFFKSRMPFRSKLVGYIIKGLKNNLTGETMIRTELVNEDSSSRRRSSSLTEQGSRHHKENLRQRMEMKPVIDETMMLFHTELTETCIDMMSRYTFSRCSALPKRPPTTQWLLNEGPSMTWLLGHKLITVTTSNCSLKAIKSGLCDKCLQSCRLDKSGANTNSAPSAPQTQPSTAATSPITEKAPSPPVENDLTPSRRRHKSAIQGSVARDSGALFAPRTKDDLHMNSRALDSENSKSEGFFGAQVEKSVDSDRGMCTCWCQGWAEINVRSATGNASWTMRLQNLPYVDASSPSTDFPLTDVSTLFFPELECKEEGKSRINSPEITSEQPIFNNSIPTSPVGQPPLMEGALEKKTQQVQPVLPSPSQEIAPSRPTSEAVPVPGAGGEPEDSDDAVDEEDGAEGESRQRNRVKRSNSSPEMSSRLRSPLSLQPPALHATNSQSGGDLDQSAPLSPTEEKKNPKVPPARVSCEAIPEEMGGTTPPTAQTIVPLLKTQPPVQTIEPKPVEPLQPQPPAVVPSTPQPPVKATLAPMKSAPMVPEKRTEKSPPQETRPDPSTLPPLSFRDRGHTISVMSPVKRPDLSLLRRNAAGGSTPRGSEPSMNSAGMKPSFVFLQLYQEGRLAGKGEKPMLVPKDIATMSIRTFDYIPPYETHKLGVLYVGENQANNETEILRNTSGSVRYTEFLSGLGTLIKLKEVDPQTIFLGGLDVNGNDGKFAYIWHDAMTQVVFHVATLMPTKETDPSCNNKKLHIGNDYVTIVFNESGQEYNMHCIQCQFNFACVVVTPMGHGTNQVTVKIKDDLTEHLGASQVTRIISDQSLPTLVRQLALHANLASLIVRHMSKNVLYASNWLERLRNIKRIRSRVLTKIEERKKAADTQSGLQSKDPDDFTDYAVYSEMPDTKN
ncbi:tuberin isoform X2 [Neocloeon triangulifer]|uniref:tuberin isoform X2 n=1 Tax=Neocloeon triangulifer TaxID=2078957 RepID=UPI00286EDEF5|nr:tuberin isoform X2 [Neocloeon triangulifer]